MNLIFAFYFMKIMIINILRHVQQYANYELLLFVDETKVSPQKKVL